MTNNQIFELIASTVARKHTHRLIGEYPDESFVLIDFRSAGEAYTDDAVCVWSKQTGFANCNEETAWGHFNNYQEAVDWILSEYPSMATIYQDCF